MKYGNVNFGQCEALINKIGGEQALKRLLAGKIVVIGPVEPWRKVKLGTGLKTYEEYRGALISLGVNTRYEGIMERLDVLKGIPFVVSDNPKEITLALVSNSDLGLKNRKLLSPKTGIPLCDTIARAKQLGLEPCSMETAFQLRLQWTGSGQMPWVHVVTEPVKASDVVDTFVIGSYYHNFTKEGDPYEMQFCYHPQENRRMYSEDDAFVFVLTE